MAALGGTCGSLPIPPLPERTRPNRSGARPPRSRIAAIVAALEDFTAVLDSATYDLGGASPTALAITDGTGAASISDDDSAPAQNQPAPAIPSI